MPSDINGNLVCGPSKHNPPVQRVIKIFTSEKGEKLFEEAIKKEYEHKNRTDRDAREQDTN